MEIDLTARKKCDDLNDRLFLLEARVAMLERREESKVAAQNKATEQAS